MDISMTIDKYCVTSLIGPPGCGKSTLIRLFNRMNDLIPEARVEGKILIDDENIYDPDIDLVALRKKVGMVFQKPNPFPKSIYQNIAWAAKIHGYAGDLDELVEQSLKKAALWEEVKDKLKKSSACAFRRSATAALHCQSNCSRARYHSHG